MIGMSEAEMIGILVISLTALITLFMAIYKPLNENTKAMTILTSNIESLAEKIEEQNRRIDEQEREFNAYKDHVRESQKRQWIELDKHAEQIKDVNHALEMCKNEHKKGE